jgi:RNA polymerase sigma factor (sigma-70 family)
MQTTFLACFEHSDRYIEGASFRAFLLGVARNILLHHYRARYRKDDKIDFGVSSILELGVSPTAIMAAQQQERQLLAVLRSLAIEQQILLELYYWEDMQGRELAELYGVPEGTIRTRLRRARELLMTGFTQSETNAAIPATTLTSLDGWARQIRDRFDEREPS